MRLKFYLYTVAISCIILSCKNNKRNQNLQKESKQKTQLTAKDILGNSEYLAISYGGYRKTTRDIQPTIAEVKEDMKILYAMKIRILRTYNVQLAQAETILKAIEELKSEDPLFEMYVMLGAWIDCKNAWTNNAVDHQIESEENEGEINRAVALANKYPSIVKIIAVGNESMVNWAASYFVMPSEILKWVNHLQALKAAGEIPAETWITSSDNFAAWGGESVSYHTEDLAALVKAVDYVSMHTYPFHDTHYNPAFWTDTFDEVSAQAPQADVSATMARAAAYAQDQYASTKRYVASIDPGKAVHIGETGWASIDNGFYGPDGSKAAGERQQQLYFE